MAEEIQELIQRAAEQGRAGSFGPEAVAVNERILKINPADVIALLRLARCHTENEDWVAAHEAYRRLLELGAGDAELVHGKLKETRERAAAQEEANRSAEVRVRAQAEREKNRQQRLDEEAGAIGSFVEARTLAIAARDARDYPFALAYHERSIELASKKGDRIGALAAKASTLRKAGRPTDALLTLNQSIELEPSRERNKPSYTSLVATLRDLGELDQARREGESLLQLHPDDSWVLFAVGRVFKGLYERDGNPEFLDRSSAYTRRAAELQPGARNIVAELRSLVELYEILAENRRAPEIAEKARALEQHIARLEPRLSTETS
jgi:tetratricopeptide (TPR) repeat protein